MDRLYRLIELQNTISFEDNQKLVGKEFEVLIEGRSKKQITRCTGRTRCFRLVHFDVDLELNYQGRLAKVRLEKGLTWGFIGSLLEVEPHPGAWSAVKQTV